MKKLLVGVVVMGCSFGVASSAPVSAAPPQNPHGVGVCMSQVAIEPGFVEANNLGEFVSSVAGPDLRGLLDDLRGDGPGGCGAPPGPGHLR